MTAPGRPRRLLQRLRRASWVQGIVARLALGVVRILGALPGRWVLRAADGFAFVIAVGNRRARRIAWQNLDAVYGPELPEAERRRIFHGSYRQLLRSALLLGHLFPLDAPKYRRWVHVREGIEQEPFLRRLVTGGGLLVSGHYGNWELLLGLRVLFPEMPRAVFLAEAVPHETLNGLLVRLRSHGDLRTALRRGGARVVARAVAEGGIAALLFDRNVRGAQGGIYVPFLGLEARTTPLAAWAALRHDKPVHPVFCVPDDHGRYRVEVGEDVTQGLEQVPARRRQHEIMRRLNAILGARIRRDPALWQWRLKRFKSRPTPEPGRHPPYSEFDPG